MKRYNIILIAIIAVAMMACNHNGQHSHTEHDHTHGGHDHSSHDHGEHSHGTTDSHAGHQHAKAENEPHSDHSHEQTKMHYVGYGESFEIFAEADPFVCESRANVRLHISHLPSFKAVERGVVTLRLKVNGKEVNRQRQEPNQRGVYSFYITPKTKGIGSLVINIENEKGKYRVEIPNVEVFDCNQEAEHIAAGEVKPSTNTVAFTKEQSWKIDFATQKPDVEPFGKLIKTTAQIQSAQSDEQLVSAQSNGFINLSGDFMLVGKRVTQGEVLFHISGSGLADDNATVRYKEAESRYRRAKAEYERSAELFKDTIVSEKHLHEAMYEYENAKVAYENMKRNFSSSGENVISPSAGSVKQVFVKNGQYVRAGEPVAVISQNKKLLLRADVRQREATSLNHITSATIRTLHNDSIYSLEQLNGKVLSYGNSANTDNYLLPVIIQIDNNGSFITGGFAELFIHTTTNQHALTIPNSALMEEQGVYFVFVQLNPELFEKREVKVGATDGLKSEILSGINRDERIVTEGAIMVKLSQTSAALDPHAGHVH